MNSLTLLGSGNLPVKMNTRSDKTMAVNPGVCAGGRHCRHIESEPSFGITENEAAE
ncbi:hypothetical protein AMST5_03868 [freshwater sediment metagenome]|uniref:Uncharacterized protein n=1 Tax=freshwater sediment metagenome TaxID=556182 RepID=A0AA48M607_9ZZZZ